MGQHIDNLAALIGSRICHDLSSPIGAVTNGLELMSMAGGTGPELDLVNESAANANARIRLFRLAFGQATEDQITSGQEIAAILRDVYEQSRLTVDWPSPPDLPRHDAQALILGLLCCEEALPQGGTIRVSTGAEGWLLEATGARVSPDANLWENLQRSYPDCDLAPAHVQFALLPHFLAQRGKTCRCHMGDAKVSLAL
ncbi:histidine phosphotransferase family protein [Roseovarius sp. MMSF_3281]|uniref:histidine phosphotransferase family protein n=1 Tax=Roseovarius sp. MMSF_3281 TaxID=3046694 RepID=UPI00273D83B8|nr:histidine phosphotransferase family protein [Roseovarius sp. MMSF_3281]